jgi:hypothetical protein
VLARRNILENIANAVDMPVKLLTQESFAEGFGEGSEDAKAVARYMDRLRETMDPVYRFLDRIVMHRAWNPDFFKMLKRKFPDQYGDMSYKEAFYNWANSFQAVWPSYLREPDSDQVKVDDTKMKAAISIYQILEFSFDPENKARLIQWICDAITNNKLLYSSPLILDYKTLVKQLTRDDKMATEQKLQGIDPMESARPEIPKVKMSRADAQSHVIQLLERINGAK